MDAATQFVLERTASDRSQAPNGAALARSIASELGGLALELKQAGAHIATERIGFARYLSLWNAARDTVFAWSDPVVTGSEKTLATVWTTSVARLTPESRRLLDRLAYLAPDPIPDSLLDVAVPARRRAPAQSPPRWRPVSNLRRESAILSRDSWHGRRIGDALAVEIDDGVMDGLVERGYVCEKNNPIYDRL
jgi:hypothetical protein